MVRRRGGEKKDKYFLQIILANVNLNYSYREIEIMIYWRRKHDLSFLLSSFLCHCIPSKYPWQLMGDVARHS